MSLPLPDIYGQVVLEVAKVAAGFVAGLLFKRKVWRFLVRAKKWLFNDILSLSIQAVRQYSYVDVKDVNICVFDHIKQKVPGVKLVQHYPEGMIISVPLFGNLIVEIEKTPIDEYDESIERAINLIVRTEIPVRLGIRELSHLTELEKYADSIFDTLQVMLFAEQKIMKKTFAVCDISRTIYFVLEKNFVLKDENLGATIRGTDSRLNITITPIANMAKAAQKYHFS
jgi:hypothetical protein